MRSNTSRLHVDRTAPPDRDFHRGGHPGDRSQQRSRRERSPVAPKSIASRVAPLVAGSRRRDRAVQAEDRRGHSSHPKTTCPPRQLLMRSIRRWLLCRRSISADAGIWTRCRGRSSANQRSPNTLACRLAGFGMATTRTPWFASNSAARSISSPALGRCSSECQNTIAAQAVSMSSRLSARTSGRVASRSSPRAARPRAARASSSAPSPAPTSSTGPGGATRSRRRARRPRVRRRTASPIPENRPEDGRYQLP